MPSVDHNTTVSGHVGLPWRRGWQRFAAWAHRVGLERKLAVVLLVCGLGGGVATYAAMTNNLPGRIGPTGLLALLNFDLVVLLGLGALVARRLVIIWSERRQGLAGARLHARLVALFSLVAVMPTIIVAVFSFLFFQYALQGWFSERVSTAIKESLAVAEAYLEEHKQTISADALAMAQDLNREGRVLLYNRERFNRTLATQALLRSLTEAVVFDGSGRVLARAGFSLLLDFDPEIPDWAMRRAREGEAVILTAETDDRVRALVKLDSFSNTYLYVGRLVDPRVLGHMDRTQGAVRLYEQLEGKRSGLQITFSAIFIVVALLLLLAAVWVGLGFANQLTRPIGRLIGAAERVRAGDLSARVGEGDGRDELDSLSRAFNRMTGQLESQRRELLDTNRELDDRRRFTETVLSGVSAGVIGLDPDGRIDLPNRSACELLSAQPDDLTGQPLSEVMPAMADLVDTAARRPRRGSQGQIQLARADSETRTLHVRVTAEVEDDQVAGFVVTFDDITELLSAQRKAAWADIARRIAHEIKNPLTPIQLSAERLKRRYLDQIEADSDRRTFEVCTDTIVRHVNDIGRMVDEFSSFARMPAPTMAEEDLAALVDQAVTLQEAAHPGVSFVRALPKEPVVIACDSQQVSRALINLLQNAVEGIAGRRGASDSLPAGEVRVRLVDEPGACVVEIEDNGRGLPRKDRHKLTEPYITTRERGTGLGLAIVKKIMEDHGGEVELGDAAEGGARVRLLFPTTESGSAGGRRSGSATGPSESRASAAHGA